MKCGLLDRDDGVSTATSKLVMKWFDSEQSNVPTLLKLFNLYENEAEVSLVANAILMELDGGKGYTNSLRETVLVITKRITCRKRLASIFY